MSYDLIVIGAGPGGYVAAIRAAQMGKKVAIVEKDSVGGTCLNRGCIPTKALTASCDVLRNIKDSRRFGIKVDGYDIDLSKVMAHKNRTVKRLVKGINVLFKKNKIDHFQGEGKLVDKNRVAIIGDETKEITGDYIIIATGSKARTFPNMNYDGEKILTSKEILELDHIPESLLVVGGGVVGCEFASIFSEMGSKVTVADIMPRLIPQEDKDLSKELERHFKRARIKTRTGVAIESVKATVDGIIANLEDGSTIEADLALLSLGRLPYTKGLGLEELDIELENGAIQVNEYLQTNVENIYAVGDVTNKVMLAHVASTQGLKAVQNIFGDEKEAMEYDVIPACIFTHPEIGSVGQTEEELKTMGIKPQVGRFNFKGNGKALTINEQNGFVKVVADVNDIIKGAQVIGPHAADLIHELALAVENGLTVKEVTGTIHAHPTLSESVMEAVEDLHGLAIHK